MPVKARLKGFGPFIPEDLQVTFYDDLPPDTLCAQCDNVSALLFRDPGGHGYCVSCKKMCTDGSVFHCYVCEKAYNVSQLKEDRSTAARIGTKRVICPNTAEDKRVHITFDALKAHLKWCSCRLTAHSPADAGHQSSAPTPVKMVPCSLCNEQLPKKEALDHTKNCNGKQKKAHQRSLHETLSSKPEEHHTGTLTEMDDLKTEIAKLRQLWRDSQSEISDQQKQLEELKVALCQKDDDIQKLIEKFQSHEVHMAKLQAALSEHEGTNQLLTETVNSQQIDMKNIGIKCEKHDEKAEKIISDMKEMFSILQEATSTISGESKYQVQLL